VIKSLIVAAAFVLATSPGGIAQDTARMEQVIQSYVTAGTFMGAVLVARDGAIVHNKAYGLANVEWEVPNTPTTKFRLGSITKQFTAASILLLEERGKLKIDAPVKTYLPDIPVSWEKITVFNLLTHTSGIPNFTALPEYGAAKLKATAVDGTIATLRDRPLDFAPGERMSYSNSGYLVQDRSSRKSPARVTRSSSSRTFSRRSA
jgi:CubicO group peptidase (beta-lactamase class C family)